MVEGGRLEIVLAVLSRYVGSNPTFSANAYMSLAGTMSARLFCKLTCLLFRDGISFGPF